MRDYNLKRKMFTFFWDVKKIYPIRMHSSKRKFSVKFMAVSGPVNEIKVSFFPFCHVNKHIWPVVKWRETPDNNASFQFIENTTQNWWLVMDYLMQLLLDLKDLIKNLQNIICIEYYYRQQHYFCANHQFVYSIV